MGVKITDINQARNWDINGKSYDLVSISGVETLTSVRKAGMGKPEDGSLVVGQHVVACVAGDMRHGYVAQVGNGWVRVAFITASAIAQIERKGYGTLGTSKVANFYVWA